MTFPLSAPSRCVRLALLTLLSVLLTDAASWAKPVTCPNAAYVLVTGAEAVADDAGVPPVLQITDGAAQIVGGCQLIKGRAKPTRRGVKVSGKWRDCGGHPKLKLKALIPATCDGIAGFIRGRGFTPAAVVGVASSCGDGVVDSNLGEECEQGVSCADLSPCDALCKCGGGGGGGTTTTTIPSSNVTVVITSAVCTADACFCGPVAGFDYHLKAAGTVSGPTGTQIRINVNAGQGGVIDCGEWTPIDSSVNPSCDVIKCCQRNAGQPETANWQALEAIELPCICPNAPGLEHNYLAQAQFASEPAVEDEQTTSPCP